MPTWPSPRSEQLGTPNPPRNPFHAGQVFRGFPIHAFATACQVARSPVRIRPTRSALESFYFQASNGSVALPVAGYDYNSDWTPLLAGLSPARMAASLAAPDPDLTLSRHPARATARRLPPSVENWSSSCCQLARSQRRWPTPFAPRALPRFNTTTRQSAPLRRIGTFGLAVGAACAFSLSIAGQVLTFHTRARLSFAPPPCRMPLGQSQCIPQADPGGMATPRFGHRLIRFRHVISGSLALASLNHTCRNLVPTFPQRSPPSLLTTAACGGLRSTPDCRPRRAFLHLSYSYAPPCGPVMLVTQDPERTSRRFDLGAKIKNFAAGQYF